MWVTIWSLLLGLVWLAIIIVGNREK